ncbi:MAG: hypothetical protein V3U73_09840 [bacterium]
MPKHLQGSDAVVMKDHCMDVARNMDGIWNCVADHTSIPFPPPED